MAPKTSANSYEAGQVARSSDRASVECDVGLSGRDPIGISFDSHVGPKQSVVFGYNSNNIRPSKNSGQNCSRC